MSSEVVEAREHKPYDGYIPRYGPIRCAWDGEEWPCRVSLLAEVAALRQALKKIGIRVAQAVEFPDQGDPVLFILGVIDNALMPKATPPEEPAP